MRREIARMSALQEFGALAARGGPGLATAQHPEMIKMLPGAVREGRTEVQAARTNTTRMPSWDRDR